MNSPQLQRGVFLALLAVVTAAFIWVLLPFFGAVLWGVALAILFTPLFKWLLKKMPGRRNAAALSTLTICLFIVILPLAMVGVSLVQHLRLPGQPDHHAVPAVLPAARRPFAVRAASRTAVPLSREYKQRLFSNFTTVIRATVKGNVLVAIAQGALGGLIFWFLRRAGAAAVGGGDGLPVAAAGGGRRHRVGAGGHLFPRHRLGLAGRGADRLRRVRDRPGRQHPAPVLVGKDTKMPDYVVLLSTIGGMALFGLNGFVIGPVIAALFIAAWAHIRRGPPCIFPLSLCSARPCAPCAPPLPSLRLHHWVPLPPT
jgi:hypothetical protein